MKHFGFYSKPLSFALAALVMFCGAVGVLPWKAVARSGAEKALESPSARSGGRETATTPEARPTEPAQISFQGTIFANARIELRAKSSGVVEKIGFKEGAPVRQGQLLVQLASTDMNAEWAAAEAEFRNSELTYRRLRTIDEQHKQLISAADLEQAKSAMETSRAKVERTKGGLTQTQITAPWDGVMGASELLPGEAVTPNTPLGLLYDLSSFKVQFAVGAGYIHQLRTGQKIRVRVEAGPPELLGGEIYFIAPSIDEATRTFLVKARLAMSNDRLIPGMYATVILQPHVKGAGDELSAEPFAGTPSAAFSGQPSSLENLAATNTASASESRKASETKELLRQEISLAEKQVALLRQQLNAGQDVQDEVIGAQHDLFSLKRQLVVLDQDAKAETALLQEELKLVVEAIADAQQRFKLKIGTELPLLALKREKLSLERELVRLR